MSLFVVCIQVLEWQKQIGRNIIRKWGFDGGRNELEMCQAHFVSTNSHLEKFRNPQIPLYKAGTEWNGISTTHDVRVQGRKDRSSVMLKKGNKSPNGVLCLRTRQSLNVQQECWKILWFVPHKLLLKYVVCCLESYGVFNRDIKCQDTNPSRPHPHKPRGVQKCECSIKTFRETKVSYIHTDTQAWDRNVSFVLNKYRIL